MARRRPEPEPERPQQTRRTRRYLNGQPPVCYACKATPVPHSAVCEECTPQVEKNIRRYGSPAGVDHGRRPPPDAGAEATT